jgi:selenide,water dikinase
MNAQAIRKPIRHDVVLIGGGHSHAQVIAAFGMRPEPGVRLTLVTDQLETPYSGMLPGLIAGRYARDEMHIDLARLARAAGVRLIHAAATGVDPSSRRVLFADRPPLRFDTLSINVGIAPDVSGIEGAEQFAICVKPISRFTARLDAFFAAARRPDGPRRVAVVGGGAAGVELAFALQARLRREAAGAGLSPGDFKVTLASGGAIAPALSAGVRRRINRRLARAGIAVATGARIARIEPSAIIDHEGRRIDADVAIVSTAARAPSWLAAAGLPQAKDGSLLTEATLQVVGETAIFATGDCAVIASDPRPKAGVFAVRQGPTLAANLRARARGEPLRRYRPQRAFLTLIETADGSAIAGRGRFLSAEGPLILKWKERIDRRFMQMFDEVGAEMARPATPDEIERGFAMRCGGCAAKIGPATLRSALAGLPPAPPPADNVIVGLDAPDDAAVVEVAPGVLQVETVDQITPIVDDPFVFGRIAALHAMNDVLAMGGRPSRALAIATIPLAAPQAGAGDLLQLLAGARRELDAAGVALIGGHTGESAELALGLSVAGNLDRASLRLKGGMRSGDRLILTKPIGVGVIMAADRRGAARASASGPAVAGMLLSNRRAAELAAPRCHALTDVSGFGLAGHLMEMLEASGLHARLDLAAIPLLPGALALAERGFASSLTSANATLESALDRGRPLSPVDVALLFDPQTSGPLLIAAAEHEAEAIVCALGSNGYARAAIIGEVLEPSAGSPGLALAGAFSA